LSSLFSNKKATPVWGGPISKIDFLKHSCGTGTLACVLGQKMGAQAPSPAALKYLCDPAAFGCEFLLEFWVCCCFGVALAFDFGFAVAKS
jgi:hypothetical protein